MMGLNFDPLMYTAVKLSLIVGHLGACGGHCGGLDFIDFC